MQVHEGVHTAGTVLRIAVCRLIEIVLFILVLGLIHLGAQNTAPAPNSDPAYQALRNLTLSGEAVTVNNVEIKRDAGTFHLHSGTVCFVGAVNGRVTGAVFSGDGNFVLTPPDSERSMLKLLTKEDEFSEKFSQMVLRFTDSSYDELKKAGSSAASGCDGGLLKDSQHTTRHKLKNNLEARILEDVLSPAAGGLFVAFIHGKRYNGEELYVIDPHESRDQVVFLTYDENKQGEWASFPLSGPHAPGTVGPPIQIEHQQLDTTLEKSAYLIGKAKTEFAAQLQGVRVVPFDLFHTLRVKSVKSEDGQPLAFIQEDKNDDADFSVILPKALTLGERYAILTEYEGKEAVVNEGAGNYFPIARSNWYPSNPGSSLGEYVTYDMTFRIPKGMQIAATGVRLSESNDGHQYVTTWKSEAPQTVAGFNYGWFKMEEGKIENTGFVVQSFANRESPDWVNALQHSASAGADLPTMGSHASDTALGTMSTTGTEQKGPRRGRTGSAGLHRIFRRSTLQAHAVDPAECLQFRPILAGTSVDSDLLLLRHDCSSRIGSGLGRSGLLEGCHASRSRAPVVGAHGWIQFRTGSVDERRFRRHVSITVFERYREESQKVPRILE